jgi:hypothetical protein
LISKQEQKKLFELVYPRQKNKTKTMIEKHTYTGLKFNQLKPVVQDIAVDIVYRGDYSMSDSDAAKKERSEIIQDTLDHSKTNLTRLSNLMADREFWVDEAGVGDYRFNMRADYMYNGCKKNGNCKYT